MANPTTNFGWVMPTSTSLVTNLPADFNTFGQGVDTSMAQLKGGTTGQVLSKTSGTDMAFTWVTPTDQTPLTTKGDLFAFSTVDARLAVGANETRLVADSTQTVGLKYVADTTNYAINAKGDILGGTAADTLAPLSVGTNGQVLQADSTAATGLKWATPSSTPTFAGCALGKSTQQSLTSGSYTDITFDVETIDVGGYHDNATNNTRITIPSGKGGYYLVSYAITTSNGATTGIGAIYKNGSRYNTTSGFTNPAIGNGGVIASSIMSLSAGDYITVAVYGGASNNADSAAQNNIPTSFGCTFLGA